MSNKELLKQLKKKKELDSKTISVDGYGEVILTELNAAQTILASTKMIKNGKPSLDLVGDMMTMAAVLAMGYSPDEYETVARHTSLVAAVGPVVVEMNNLMGEDATKKN